MGKPIRYRQCRLEKREPGRRMERMSWLPECYAVLGAVVKLLDTLKSGQEVWTDGWRVTSCSGPIFDEKRAVDQCHAHTRQRRASDI
jgi:hypothetical protein